jgi:hypothetical protein
MTKHSCISSTKYIYTKGITVSVPSPELGPPIPQTSMSVPPNQRGGGHTRLRVRGWGGLYTLSAL